MKGHHLDQLITLWYKLPRRTHSISVFFWPKVFNLNLTKEISDIPNLRDFVRQFFKNIKVMKVKKKTAELFQIERD